MSKNQSASGLTNFVQYDSYGNIKFVSGSNTLMTVSASGAIITTGTISGSAAANATSASYASNADLLDGLDSTVFTTTSSFNTTSASLYATSASLSTASGSFNTRVSALEATGSALSSSILSVSSSAYATSGSLSVASGSFNTRVATIESKYATTGSNNFRAPQYVSDTTVPTGFANTTGSIYTDGGLQVTKDAYFSSSMYIKGNLTIYGTQSVAYITSSQLNIATNLITVNTATPAVRFGGLAVYDSGSTGTGMTGSLLWDSQNNSWIYDNPSGSGNYDSAMVIMGPRNASALGSEQGLTCNYLVQGHGHHHVTSSQIYHDGTNTCIPNTLIGGTVCTSTLVVNKSNPVLYINAGNSETSTIGFTQPSVSGYGGYIKTTTGLGDRAMTFGLSAAGTNNDATEIVRIDDSGVTCFGGAICTSLISSTVSGGYSIILNKASGPAIQFNKTSATAQSWQITTDPDFRIYDDTAAFTSFRITAATGAATFSCKIGIAGASATYPLTVYNGSNGTTAAFGGTTYGIRIDNDGTFSCGRSTIYGVDASFYGSYQPLAIGASNLFFSISGTDRFNIGTTGIACFACQVCAPVGVFSGCVGIGTAPTQSGTKLQVAGVTDIWSSANTLLRLNHDGTRGIIETYTGGGYANTAINPSGGNVLIGSTTDYSGILQANGTISIIKNSGYGLIHYTNNTSTNQYFLSQAVSNGFLLTVGKNGACTQPYLALGIADGEIMRIANTGCVGINVTSPKTPLEVANIHNGTSGGSVLTLSSITNAAYGQCMVMQGYFSDTGNGECAILGAISIEKWRPAGQCNGGDIAFYTRTPAGSNMNNPTERARIYNNGSIRFTMSGTNTAILEQSYSIGGNGCINVCFDIYNAIPGKGSGYVFQADIHVGGYGSAGASGLLYKASVAGYDGHYVGLGSYHKDAELVKCASGVDIKIYNPPGCSCLLGVTIYNCSGTYSHVGTMRMVITY